MNLILHLRRAEEKEIEVQVEGLLPLNKRENNMARYIFTSETIATLKFPPQVNSTN